MRVEHSFNYSPRQREIHPEVRVAQVVGPAGDLLPRNGGRSAARLVGQLLDRFADHFELAPAIRERVTADARAV